jgi:hypothetical protein
MTAREIEYLRSQRGFWYLATPYTKYGGGIEAAFREASRINGHLFKRGVHAYSPIAHSHPVAEYSQIDPLDHSFWLPVMQPMMDLSCGMIIAKMEGWGDSYGIGEERKVFERQGKPIFYLDMPLDE